MIKQISFLIILSVPFFGNGQTIKTKIQESGYEVKPDAQKIEQFEEARIFVYAGAGFGIRQGKITTGFLVGNGQGQNVDPNFKSQTTNKPEPFRNGFHAELGFRYFTESNFGFGAKGSLFVNSANFLDTSGSNQNLNISKPAKAMTNIYNGNIEGLYRFYLSKTNKSIFVYGGLALGISIIDQEQSYTVDRKTTVNSSFFSTRPFAGIQIPVWDVIHVYAEGGYNFSQGKISSGTLSLSKYQIVAGIQIRLNEF